MFVPSFCEFIKYSQNFATGMSVSESGSGRCHGWTGLGFFSSCNSSSAPFFFPHSLIGFRHRDFCFFFLLGYPRASLGDTDASPAFSKEHGHLGTMREQCCALNGLPRFVDKNE